MWFSERYPQFTEKGAVVLGVSKGFCSLSQRNLKKNMDWHLHFWQIQSVRGIKVYDVWKEKKKLRKGFYGVVKNYVSLLMSKGIIIKANDKVKGGR